MIKKTLFQWLIGVFALIAILVILLLTPLGLRVGLHMISAMAPGKMTYQHASGMIIGPIEIKNFKYVDKKTVLIIRKLKLYWNPWQLLHHKLDVEHFSAHTVYLTLGASSSKEKKSTTKKYLLLNIHKGHIYNFSIGYKPHDFPMFVSHIQFKVHVAPKHIDIESDAQVTKPLLINSDLSIKGTFNHYTLSSHIASQQFRWYLSGLGNEEGMALNLNENNTLDGKLFFNANIKWPPSFQWDIKLNSAHLNLKRLNPRWPNALSVNLNTTGVVENTKTTFDLKTLITAPGTRIHFSANQKDQLNAEWNMNITDLSNLYEKFQGAITTQGKFTSQGNIPTLNATLQGNHIHGSHYSFDQINLQIQGKQTSHQIKGNINITGNTIDFQMQGGIFNSMWKGVLQKLTLYSREYRTWQLIKPTNITLASSQVSAQNLCLTSPGASGQLCLNGKWDSQTPWQFTVTGQQFNLGLITPFLSPQLSINSPLSLNATVRGRGSRIEFAKGDVILNSGNIKYYFGENLITTPLQKGNIKISIENHHIATLSKLIFSKNNQLELSLTLPDFSDEIPLKKQRIRGKLKTKITDLSPFNKILDPIAKPNGELFLDLSLKGYLIHPNIEGDIVLSHGSLYIPRLGISLSRINSKISSRSDNKLDYKMTAYSKDQPIYLNGFATRTPTGVESTTTIEGNHVLIMDTKEYTIYATPKLKAIIQGKNVNLTGSVDIPQGIIQPIETRDVVALPSDQIVYTAGDSNAQQEQEHAKISANVNVSLGNNVRVNTAGLDAMVTGKATIIGQPHTTTLAHGRINITEGNYNAYGRVLNITPGSYIEYIQSPTNNPYLNIRATKSIPTTQLTTGESLAANNIIVGVSLRGTFLHPEITFFSIPSNLSQSDILSYLVLGYSSDQTGGSNLGILLEAANSLSGKSAGVGGAISDIKQGLGLSELGVESQTVLTAIGTPIDQQTAFVIGKHLTKNIYIRYSYALGQGPFIPVNIFQLRYTINSHWAIQTDSSTLGSGADILYTIETD